MKKTIRDPIVEEIVEQMRGRPRPDQASVRAAIREIQEQLASLRILDSRTADEIIGYDQFGLPEDVGTDFSATDIPTITAPNSLRHRQEK
ncbi:MAG TPA: hypothetical protein VK752_31095 [Bryobacteraceae bacterium]|jgi:hypothetical protein|nr:hypothetical protein [Bryobacteraceae bacterium]